MSSGLPSSPQKEQLNTENHLAESAEQQQDTAMGSQSIPTEDTLSSLSTATNVEDDLPPLLKTISTGSFDGYFDAGSTLISQNSSSLRDSALADFEGFSAGNPPSQSSIPEATTIDISKLVSENDEQTLSNQSTPKSAEVGTPKSILQKKSVTLTPNHSHVELSKKVSFSSRAPNGTGATKPDHTQTPTPAQHNSIPKSHHDDRASSGKRRFFSQPMPTTTKLSGKIKHAAPSYRSGPVHVRRTVSHDEDVAKKQNYVLFRTKSSRQLSRLQSRRHGGLEGVGEESTTSSDGSSNNRNAVAGRAMPAGRYFDALKGPELDDVKESEELLLPHDQLWPFLLRFPIGCFGICLGLGSQAMLWKTLAMVSTVRFLRVPLAVNLVLWCLALFSLVGIAIIYALKSLMYLEAVRREYYHPVRVNFFFAPWIACMFLTLGLPPRIATTVHPAIWCLFTTPILMLELKIYGQWLSGGARRLSKVANPSTHLSLVGNFISSLVASLVGWKEPAIFFFAVGCAHYIVVFVTLYQRLPTSEVLTKELHPVFFLFVAAPSAASVAWKNISGQFDYFSRIPYFLGLFLYASLVVRISFFCGFKFSLTWWAYTFPMTACAIATIHYSLEVQHPITQAMAVILSAISSLIVFTLFVSTLVHAATGMLFPNDFVIAITRKKKQKHKQKNKESHLQSDSSKSFSLEPKLENDVDNNALLSLASDPLPLHCKDDLNGLTKEL